MTLARTFKLYSITSEKIILLKICSTGVALININRKTINTAWALGIQKTRGYDISKLSDKMWFKLRLKYSELELVIIN